MGFLNGYHHQNLSDGELPLWRNGRAWLGKWNWEWNVLCYPKLSICIEKGGYDDDRVQFHVGLILFTLYVSRSFSHSLESRELSIYWFQGSLWIKPWIDDDYYRDRPWHRNVIALHIKDWILGALRCAFTEGEPVDVLIPMPEGCYRATATPFRRQWVRRFGLFKVVREGWDFDIPGGIPFEGKGENGWDCGEDGLCGMGVEGSLERGIGTVVGSVLETRQRRDGSHVHRGLSPRMVHQ